MTPDQLMTLQLRYARSVFLAEQHRHESEQLREQLLQAARGEAFTGIASDTTPVTTSQTEAFTAEKLAALCQHATKLPGLYTRTAAATGLSIVYVRKVALGERTSDRATAELLCQWQMLEQGGGE